MYSRMLVPLDGSRLAESVLPVVKGLCRLFPCAVTLLHVIEKDRPTSIHGDTHLAEPEAADAYMSEIARQFIGLATAVETHVHTVPQGDVPRCIADHARELDRDLVVICTHGKGGLRRFVFGSNAEQVLSHGKMPVILVQAGSAGELGDFGASHILVLLNDSPETLRALDLATELARASGASLLLLGIVPTTSDLTGERVASRRISPHATQLLLEIQSQQSAEIIEGQVRRLRAEGLSASGRVERAEAADAILDASRSEGIDLVVLTAKGLTGLGAFWAKDTVRKLAGSFPGALLLLPAESR